MGRMTDFHEAAAEFSAWAARGPGRLLYDRAVRLKALSNRVGDGVPRIPSVEHGRLFPPRTGFPDDPMPAPFVVWTENAAKGLHCPRRQTRNGESVYVLPRWLLRTRPRSRDLPPNGLRIRLRHGPALVCIEDPATSRTPAPNELHAVLLRPQIRSQKRRIDLWEKATLLVRELESILGTSVSDWAWLQQMIDDPAAAEDQAIEIWNEAISELDLPESFRLTQRSISLRDLLILSHGLEEGRHRRAFADQQPWAAMRLLDGPNPHAAFGPIDRNPANAIQTSAGFLCCSGDESGCVKAAEFARSLARHRGNPDIDRLLGSGSRADGRIRSLLMEAHKQDAGELLSLIRGDVQQTRRQIQRAEEVLRSFEGMSSSFACAYTCAVLLVRMMIRDRFDPRYLDPAAMASGLIAVSADCLASFAADRLSDPTVDLPDEHEDCDSVDFGVLALARFVGRTRKPQLTMRQLTRFAEAAGQRSVHRIEGLAQSMDTAWPPPMGFREEEHCTPSGARIKVLATLDGVHEEGRQNGICLADGRYGYVLAAILGRLVLFSIRSGDHARATLALKPTQERRGSKVLIRKWAINQIRGPGNAPPDDACSEAAESLCAFLNERCPCELPKMEIARRLRIRREIDEFRSFNRNLMTARNYWYSIYLDLLPRRFAEISPAGLIDSYLGRK